MRDFVTMLVQGVMDALEEFFESLTAPSTKFTLNAFLYSLVFLVMSIVLGLFEVPSFVSWQECVTCSLLMFVIVLIDSSVRSDIKSGMGKLKEVASKFSYSGEEAEEDEEVSIPMEEENVKEVNEDGTAE